MASLTRVPTIQHTDILRLTKEIIKPTENTRKQEAKFREISRTRGGETKSVTLSVSTHSLT